MKQLIAIMLGMSFVFGILPTSVSDSSESEHKETQLAKSNYLLSYTFAVGADLHHLQTGTENNEGERTLDFVNNVNSHTNIQRVFLLGDIAYDNGTYYDELKEDFLDELNFPYHVVRGNHDLWNATNEVNPNTFMDVFGLTTLYYNVTVGWITWIMLDSVADYWGSTPTGIGAEQLQYLENALNYYEDNLCFVMMHMNNKLLAYPAHEAVNYEFERILREHAGHLGGVFCGHVHGVNAIPYNIDSVRYFYVNTIGSNYAMMFSGYYAYMIVEVGVYSSYWVVQTNSIDIEKNEIAYGSTYEFMPDYGTPELSSVWNAVSDASLASVAGNWLNGVPEEGESAIFNSTSVKTCIWDINVTNNLLVFSNYTGTITQSTMHLSFEDMILWGGTFVPQASYWIIISGNALASGTRYSANYLLNAEYSGDHALNDYTENTPIYLRLTVSGNVFFKNKVYANGASSLGCIISGIAVINEGVRLTTTKPNLLTVTGTIIGWGENLTQGALSLYPVYANFDMPDFSNAYLDCSLRLQCDGNCYISMTDDLNINGTLIIRRSGDTSGSQIMTLCTNNYSINCGGLYPWIGGYLKQWSSDINVAGNFDDKNGTFVSCNGDLVFSGDWNRVAFKDGNNYNNLYVDSEHFTITLYKAEYLYLLKQEISFACDVYHKTTVSIYDTDEDYAIQWQVTNATSSTNFARFYIGGLDKSTIYRTFQDGEYLDEDFPENGYFSIESEGNHSFAILEWGNANQWSTQILSILVPLIVAMVIVTIVVLIAIRRKVD